MKICGRDELNALNLITKINLVFSCRSFYFNLLSSVKIREQFSPVLFYHETCKILLPPCDCLVAYICMQLYWEFPNDKVKRKKIASQLYLQFC